MPAPSQAADARQHLETLRLAVQQHQAGALPAAEALYRRVLEAEPGQPDALHLLGVAAYQAGRHGEAVDLIGRAIAANPQIAQFHTHQSAAFRALGDLESAATSLRRALAIDPNDAAALNDYGAICQGQGRLDEASRHLRRAIVLDPNHADARANLGAVLQAQGRYAEAIANYRRALEIRPDHVQALVNLGNLLQRQGQLKEALHSFERAVSLSPSAPEHHLKLGVALQLSGQIDQARQEYECAIELDPGSAEAHNNVGAVLGIQGRTDEAADAFARSLALEPNYPEALTNEGAILLARGDLDQAISRFERALDVSPIYVSAHSNLIFALDLHPRATLASMFAERRRWNDRHALPLAERRRPLRNLADPERRLRVGYVSADFLRHSAAATFGPVVLNHDPAEVEVICYSGVTQEDEVTERFRSTASLWRSTVGMTDELMAELIQQDLIDILVDLSGHSVGNRLLVFAQKPAPVQVSGWGYAVGTGLDAMGYFLGDPVAVPIEAEAYYSERVIRLPSVVPFEPPDRSPEIAPPPCLAGAPVTFGSFNRPQKLNDEMLDWWARILTALPESRLMLKFGGLEQPSTQQRIREVFSRRGVTPERIELLGASGRQQHLAQYGQVDLALDPFPHGGGVSTLESLWMGVPVVTLMGEHVSGRLSASVLTTLGLNQFIARTSQDYVDRALQHAQDACGLADLRQTLRNRLSASILCDHRAYCRAAESAYREMWRRWCAKASTTHQRHTPSV